MTSIFASDSTADLSADSTIQAQPHETRQPELSQSVGQAAQSLTADQREASIKLAGHLVERHMRLANEDPANYFLHRGNADRARLQQRELIAGRTNPQERTE